MTTTQQINIGGRNVQIDIPAAYAAVDIPDLSEHAGLGAWYDLADEIITDESDSIYRYDLGGGLSLYVDVRQGNPSYAYVAPEDIEERLHEWWLHEPSEISEAEYREAWGLDGLAILKEADEDYEGACRVWHEPHYYAGHINAPRGHFARDEDGEIIEFATREDAAEYVHEYYSRPSQYDGIPACNVLSHGQAGADTLTIVQA